MSADDIAIRVDGLSKCYHVYERPQDRLKQSLWLGRKQFYREFWALRDVSFTIRKGETFGIIGRNGSGKSTLLQMIVGTLSPTSGAVTTYGRVAALLELGSGFNPDFTGRENVFMNGAILGLSKPEIAWRFDEIVAFADIGDFIEQPVKTYSSGMMVRLAFAVSVCVEPDILIVDEALAVGDMAFQFKCMERLDKLTKSGTTLLFVSHDIGAVKAFSQQAIYLDSGTVKAKGSASDMAELYFCDIREEQKRGFSNGHRILTKPAIGGEKALAFGTDQGRVVRAVFNETGGTQAAFITGDCISIEVEVEYDSSLNNPSVSMILCDYRMIDISGRYFTLNRRQHSSGISRATVRFSFLAELNKGNYFITIRLEERLTDDNLTPIDKQVGALSFNVIRQNSNYFMGMFHLPISVHEDPTVEQN